MINLKECMALFLSVFVFMSAPCVAETANISIKVNERQSNGLPWRGTAIPNIMKGPFMFGQLHNTSPTITLCIVIISADVSCGVNNRGQLSSPCPLSYDCEFDAVLFPPDEIFGLLFISQGMINKALIDAVVVTRRQRANRDPRVLELDVAIREAAARIAPPDPTEASRRTRRWAVYGLSQCEMPCTLTQSSIKWSIDP